MADIPDMPIEPPEPYPCNQAGPEGCEGCDARNTAECPERECPYIIDCDDCDLQGKPGCYKEDD